MRLDMLEAGVALSVKFAHYNYREVGTIKLPNRSLEYLTSINEITHAKSI